MDSSKDPSKLSSTAVVSAMTGIRPGPSAPHIESKMQAPQQALGWEQRDIQQDADQKQELLKDPQKMLKDFWDKRVIDYKEESVINFRNFMIAKNPMSENAIKEIFASAIENKDFDAFNREIQKYGPELIYEMYLAERLLPAPSYLSRPREEIKSDIGDMKKYMEEKKMSASITLRADAGEFTTVDSLQRENTSKAQAIHSVGKVFTGMLAMKMVREKDGGKNIINEKDLKSPIHEVNGDFLKTLPDNIQKYIRENDITLHQLMTHMSGLGDYLEAYENEIKYSLEHKSSPPNMACPKDFLRFAEQNAIKNPPDKSNIGKFNYSNTALLLVGLAIEHAYNKNKSAEEKMSYDQILKKYIIDDAKMSCFSTRREDVNGIYNPADITAPYFMGSPAGGYWSTTEDLAKFGKWIYEQCKTDAELSRLVKTYGKEFYRDPDNEFVIHPGNTPTSTSFFSVSLQTGAVVAVLAPEPNTAGVLHWAAHRHILYDKTKEAIEEKAIKVSESSIQQVAETKSESKSRNRL